MAQYEEFAVDQGTDLSLSLELIQPSGTPKNLTGRTITGSLKKSFGAADSDAVTFTTTITSFSQGEVTLTLTNVQTSALNAGRYVYDVEMSYLDSDSNTIIERILEGKLDVQPSVIR